MKPLRQPLPPLAALLCLLPLVDDPRFRALRAATAESAAPRAPGQPFAEIDRIDLIPEGIARDSASGRLFFGSMRSGDVFVLDADGNRSRFATVRHGTRLAAIGMTVDAARGLLWVIGTSWSLNEAFDPDAPTVSGLFGFDLDSGELRHKALRDDAGFGYNDVTLAPNGDVYVSGSQLGRLSAELDAIETLTTSEAVSGSNGLAVTDDGAFLIASAYRSGIAVVRLADGATHFLEAPGDVPLRGIDGLYLHDGDLIAVQNGVEPWRLMRFSLNRDLTRIVAARTLESGSAAVATTGAIDADGAEPVIHYIAQGAAPTQPPAHLPAAARQYLGRTVIMTVPLR